MKTVEELTIKLAALTEELENLECIIGEAVECGDYDDETDLVEVIYQADDLRLRISALKRQRDKATMLNS